MTTTTANWYLFWHRFGLHVSREHWDDVCLICGWVRGGYGYGTSNIR